MILQSPRPPVEKPFRYYLSLREHQRGRWNAIPSPSAALWPVRFIAIGWLGETTLQRAWITRHGDEWPILWSPSLAQAWASHRVLWLPKPFTQLAPGASVSALVTGPLHGLILVCTDEPGATEISEAD